MTMNEKRALNEDRELELKLQESKDFDSRFKELVEERRRVAEKVSNQALAADPTDVIMNYIKDESNSSNNEEDRFAWWVERHRRLEGMYARRESASPTENVDGCLLASWLRYELVEIESYFGRAPLSSGISYEQISIVC